MDKYAARRVGAPGCRSAAAGWQRRFTLVNMIDGKGCLCIVVQGARDSDRHNGR
jgi:hypothetical protein